MSCKGWVTVNAWGPILPIQIHFWRTRLTELGIHDTRNRSITSLLTLASVATSALAAVSPFPKDFAWGAGMYQKIDIYVTGIYIYVHTCLSRAFRPYSLT